MRTKRLLACLQYLQLKMGHLVVDHARHNRVTFWTAVRHYQRHGLI